VIEDEPQIGRYISQLLGQLHGIVDVVGSIADAEQALDSFKYDLAIVDRMLPDGDALEVVAALGRLPERPAIIMLTAKDAKEDVVEGLNGGADDYLGKPFEPQELIARVRAVLRRPRQLAPSVLSFGNVELHLGSSEAIVADSRVLLRRREALILAALLMRRDRVVTRDALIEEIYGFDDEIESNTLEAQVSRLRRKLTELGSDVEIRSMRGIGYILRMAKRQRPRSPERLRCRSALWPQPSSSPCSASSSGGITRMPVTPRATPRQRSSIAPLWSTAAL